MYFFYVCSSWEGSANDARVLENAELHDFPHMTGRLWLADAGYGMKLGYLTPHRTVRYHLREQALARLRPQTKEELFNLRHAQLRNFIEWIFDVVKERFQILKTPMCWNCFSRSGVGASTGVTPTGEMPWQRRGGTVQRLGILP